LYRHGQNLKSNINLGWIFNFRYGGMYVQHSLLPITSKLPYLK